jgi:UDP-N-acetylmuramyl pentapeptide phosphotransferase/UDP-N-acetylglucosamine-1-phosphate transferase
MTLLASFVAGAVVTLSLLHLARQDILASPLLTRVNYRGRNVPTAIGVTIVLALFCVEVARVLLRSSGVGPDTFTAETGITADRLLVLAVAAGFGLVGLLDDVIGAEDRRGFKEHIGSLLHGRLTTGGIKIIGGGAVALFASAAVNEGNAVQTLADGALIALCANLGNLFDRAPGRTIKVALLAYIPMAVMAGGNTIGVAMAPLMGAAVGLLPADLKERIMLGDAGANVLGGALGFMAVRECNEGVQVGILVGAVLLNLAAERWSFSKIISKTAPLRFVDMLGREKVDS